MHLLGGAVVNQESCTQYNILKIAQQLLRWTGAAEYGDFMERASVNGILGTQRGLLPGEMLYMLPLGAGVSKAGKQHWRDSGWGTPFESFWCCYGTLIESFAKLGDGVFFQPKSVPSESSSQSVPQLYIMQFVSSELIWHAAGLKLHLRVHTPEPLVQPPRPLYEIIVSFETLAGAASSPR
ncbi:hypothetical protein CYMTET_23398 [Cymbomonas tetramitiformis]|uniref:Non-reducing end beta-L-arabinofuranosidase-like GH127 catalytic domain-containing protein n=1 Tax=Cymbomonas tetramitiformis TaxID=36881 RepID=A0AAE0L0Z8_9CHLO|nr:hypothetical protein CYMTET_23398 [Cymbomonas tetramitiformis]